MKENRIEVVKGDLTTFDVDAIVNAANTSLLGGGGVDGAIHRKAGQSLLAECKALGGCDTGQAKITKGYNLPCKHVIHTVGPIYNDGLHNEEELLYSCYKHSLELAVENDVVTIAFPCISTGVYRYPLKEACDVSLRAIKDFLQGDQQIEKVYLVCFNDAAFDTYKSIT